MSGLSLEQTSSAANDDRPSVPVDSVAARRALNHPVLDVGVYITAYFFSLVLLSNVLLAVGVVIGPYHCFIAALLAYLILAWYRGRDFLYALPIAVAGLACIALCAWASFLFTDLKWDSNWYHKLGVGLLAEGWNPFTQASEAFAKTLSYLPANEAWASIQIDGLPKATWLIGACFYRLTGFISTGKCYHYAFMIALVCFLAPLLSAVFKIKPLPAFLIALLTAVNPVTLPQSITYYNDGLIFLIATLCGASFAYMSIKPRGRYARGALFMAVMSLCLLVNIKTSGILYGLIIWGVYAVAYFLRGVKDESIPQKQRVLAARRFTLRWFGMAVGAIFVFGAVTYTVNWFRFGSPVYGMLGDASINSQLDTELAASAQLAALPYIAQVFSTLFSVSNAHFTDMNLKIPFTVHTSELEELSGRAIVDMRMGGWGILFSGIFLMSLAVIVIALVRTARRKSKWFGRLFVPLLVVLVPLFFIPFLCWGRYYPQLLWVATLALIILFAARRNERLRIWSRLAGIAMLALLALNCWPHVGCIKNEYDVSKAYRAKAENLAALQADYDIDITLVEDQFYGLLYNLRDAGVRKYDYIYTADYDPNSVDGDVYDYVLYNLTWRSPTLGADTDAFLRALKNDDYVVAVAACGETTYSLSGEVSALMRALGLAFEREGLFANSYLAVIDGASVEYERSGEDALTYDGETASGVRVHLESCGGLSQDAFAHIAINGVDYAVNHTGYNIVVYSKSQGKVVDSVRIHSYLDNALYR